MAATTALKRLGPVFHCLLVRRVHSITKTYLRHINGSDGQCFKSQNGSVFVLFSTLQHYMQLVALPLEKVGILKRKVEKRNQ